MYIYPAVWGPWGSFRDRCPQQIRLTKKQEDALEIIKPQLVYLTAYTTSSTTQWKTLKSVRWVARVLPDLLQTSDILFRPLNELLWLAREESTT
jgi:hypothetical protein